MTIILCIIIFAAFILSWIYVYNLNDADVKKNKQWIEQLPSLVSALGVIGTFIGITIGLSHFNEKDLDASIPALLDGLKVAFYTSLFGMIGSLILTRIVNHKFDNICESGNDIDLAAKSIVDAINDLKKESVLKMSELRTSMQSNASDNKGAVQDIRTSVSQARDDIEEMKIRFGEIAESIQSLQGSASRQEISQLTSAESTTVIENAITDLTEQLKVVAENMEKLEQKISR